jgi:nucleoside-diphosphate-sugar epimerase
VRGVVLGGTGFIGGYVVQALVRNGHDVAVFHRGVDEPDLPSSVRHIHGRFDRLADYGSEFRRLRPDVVLDMVPYINKESWDLALPRYRRTRSRDLQRGCVSGLRAAVEE